MAEFWVSIVKGYYAEDAGRLRSTFLAEAARHGITIKTDEPVRNEFRFRVGYDGAFESFHHAVSQIADMDASVSPSAEEDLRYRGDTVVMTPFVRI